MGAPPLEILFRQYAETQDESAARELVARTRPRLLAIARRIGDPADAEDSVQTAYLSLLHKNSDFAAPVLAWLVTATVRIAYRAKAKRQRLNEIAQTLVHPPAQKTPAALAEDADEMRLMRERVVDLPASLRDAAVLHYFHGLSTGEVAKLLDLSRDAVKKRLQRARFALRSSWGPRLAPLLFALPWWCVDTAAAAGGIAGGLVMKKLVVVVGVLIALAATTVGVAWQQRASSEREQAPRASMATRTVDEPATEPETKTVEKGGAGAEEDYSGIVVTPDGKPMAGANVHIGAYFWSNGSRMPMLIPAFKRGTTTDSEGRFTLQPHYTDNIDAVEYNAHADGYVWSSARSRLDEQARIVLRRGGALALHVRREDGTAVKVAMQFVNRSKKGGGFEAFLYDLAPDARFDLQPGEYQVRAQAEGLVPSRRKVVSVVAGETTTVNFKLMGGVAYAVEVVDSEGGGIEGALVEISGPGASHGQAKTDEFGRCRITGIGIPHKVGANPYESARFKVTAEGFALFALSVRVPDTEGEETVRLQLARGARVVFRVIGPDGKPVKKARLYVYYTSTRSHVGHQLWNDTDENGEVIFPALEKGSALVQVMEVEKHPRTVKLTGKPQEVVIDLRPGNFTIAGTVRGPDGALVKGGEVAFLPAAHKKKGPGQLGRTAIAADGSFVVTGLEEGDGSLWVWAPGFEAVEMPARAPAHSMLVRVRDAEVVAGVVVTRAGDPVAGVPVRLERSYGGWAEVGIVHTNAKGGFSFRGVRDGPKLHVRVRNKQWIESTGLGYVIQPGDESVRLTVKPAAEGWGLRIPLELVDERGAALHGRVQIQYTRDGKRGRWHLIPKVTETPGRFVLPYYDLPGVCDFKFSMTGRMPTEVKGYVVADKADLPVLRIVLRPGAVLTVFARHPDGTPVAGKVLHCGTQAVRTDAAGRVDFGGFEPGSQRVEVYDSKSYYVTSGSVVVELPGRVELVIMKRGSVLGRAAGKGPFHWKLTDAEGVVQDERTTEANSVRLFTEVAGRHRLVVRSGDEVVEHEAMVKLGGGVVAGKHEGDD